MVNKKSAPQQEILEIDRVGNYGKVEYRHRLVCGHTEVRKRASVAPKIACTKCVIGSEFAKELQSLTIVPSPNFDEEWFFEQNDGTEEIDVAKLKAGLVSFLGCEHESVEIVSEVDEGDGLLKARYVTIFLDVESAKNLLNTRVRTVDTTVSGM